MKNKSLLGALAAVLAITAACGSSNTNANKSAASPSPSAAASPKPSTASSPAASAEAKGFSLVNNTGVEIHSLYISPSDSKDWQEDILGRDTLADGETTAIKFERNEKTPKWDMRIEDSDGNFIEWEDLDLLALKKVTLHYKNGKATAETE
jgi:hypothetical protein